MFKKRRKMLAILTAVAIVAAGCGSSKQTESSASSNGSVKLVYARGKDSDTDKQHDQYVTVFSAGGTDYDVVDVDVDVVWPSEFAQAGYALPLDKYIAKDGINLKDYMEGPVKAVTFKGKVWGLPKYIDAGMLFYRKDLVDKAPESWE